MSEAEAFGVALAFLTEAGLVAAGCELVVAADVAFAFLTEAGLVAAGCELAVAAGVVFVVLTDAGLVATAVALDFTVGFVVFWLVATGVDFTAFGLETFDAVEGAVVWAEAAIVKDAPISNNFIAFFMIFLLQILIVRSLMTDAFW